MTHLGLPIVDERSLLMADALTRQLAAAPPVLNVLGPANASVLVHGGLGFSVRNLIEFDGMIGRRSGRTAVPSGRSERDCSSGAPAP